jgi:hypothetical protein
MHQPAAYNFGTWGSGEVILEVATNPVTLPEGQRTDVRRSLGKFGDDSIVNLHGFR